MHASGTAFQLSSRTRPGRKAPLAFALGVLLWLAPATGAAAADVSGHWSGYWLSCTSGHSGPLHAQLCRIDDTTYQAEFSGRFWRVFPFRYSVVLNVVSEDEHQVTLAGDSYLGRLFGTFTYSATVDGESFVAIYSSCRDQGKFVLQRCGCQ